MSTTAPQIFGDRFLSGTAVHHYEHDVYRADGFDAFIWSMQRPVLRTLFEEQRRERGWLSYVDFACGTGRIAAAVEDLTDEAVAIDISPEMIDVAREKLQRTTLVVGDLLHDASLVQGRFGVITAFRFFLNVEPTLRVPAMQLLARLAEPDGLVVFNVHGNRHSVRHLGVARRRRRGERHSEMTPQEIDTLIAAAGLRVVARHGYGLLPRSLHDGAGRHLARLVDRWAVSQSWLRDVSQDLLYVCRRA
jgi:SAM-dependent methyltransferase